MESNIHDLVLESMDTQLILAEGFIDTTKKTLKKVIDKIIELCKKFISFLKDKLTKGLDATEQMIAKVKKMYKEAGTTQPTPEKHQVIKVTVSLLSKWRKWLLEIVMPH